MLKKYWSGKPLGFFSFLATIVYLSVKNFYYRIYSRLVLLNVGKYSRGVRIYGSVVFRYPGNISINKDVKIDKGVNISSSISSSRISIGDNTWIGRFSSIDYTGGLDIGNNVTISEHCLIETHDHGLNPRSNPIPKKLIIEDNAWLGANSTVLQNVNRIGANSIIAAGAIVTEDVPEKVIVGGVPAKVIRVL
jgi:acetyltransferase-like isoleucine patch superfamily enzyme